MKEINDSQKAAAIKLYKDGVTNYKDISARLGVTYNAVNRVMTTWKRETGILKAKADAFDDDVMEELNFLRKFYLSAITKGLQH